MTIEQSELREKIAREIRLAMAKKIHGGAVGARLIAQEDIAYLHADAIMALIGAKS
jgi:hypothetical protein